MEFRTEWLQNKQGNGFPTLRPKTKAILIDLYVVHLCSQSVEIDDLKNSVIVKEHSKLDE